MKFNNIILETFVHEDVTHQILLSLDTHKNIILLQPKTLNVAGLEKFVKFITSQNINITNIVLYQPTITRNDKNGNELNDNSARSKSKITTTITWDCFNVYTNKTLHNTIISNKVQTEFLDDLQNFMNTEDYYNEKGIPYKRGYMLYGPPGTGKTSLVKAIANTFSMDIYLINMEDVKTAADITKLFKGFHNTNSHHIVCFEDIDRCEMFKKPKYCRFYDEPTNIRAFLNELDGISEGNKRITIFTANDTSVIDTISALCRPGRIDKKIEIGYCDHDQLNRLFNHYTCSNTTLDLDKLDIEITPADTIKLLLSDSKMTSDEFKCKLLSKNNDLNQNDNTNNNTNNKNNKNSKKRKEITPELKLSKITSLAEREHKKVKTTNNKLIKRLYAISDNLDNDKIPQIINAIKASEKLHQKDFDNFDKQIENITKK